MPKRCTDPRCPLNKYLNGQRSQKDSYKIHEKPCVPSSCDGEREHRNEHKRTKCTKLKHKKPQEKNDRCGICCKNKKCNPSLITTEHATSTDPLTKTRSKKSGMKGKAHRYEEDEGGRRCECRIKKCYEPKRKKNKKRHRSRKKKGKCSWLKKCLRSFFFCCKGSKRSRSCKSHVKRNSPQNCEYCCKYRDVC